MSLKAPGILTFIVSVVLVVTVLMVRFFGANVPFLAGGHEFWGLLVAYIVVAASCFVHTP